MKPSFDSQSIQNQMREISDLLARMMPGLELTDKEKVPVNLKDLARLSNSIDVLQMNVENHLQTQARQIGALLGLGTVINSSRGLKRVLDEVIDQLIALLGAERGFLMLVDEQGELGVQIARGMDKEDVDKEAFAISHTIARRVAETGEVILTTNAENDPRFDKQYSVNAYHLLSILCAPLKIKEDLIGVLYVDNRAHSGIFRQGDLEWITAFSNQAAVAIENARLFEELQTSYQATLEGWVRALDLRDKETEGHTQRVTETTAQLARWMGIDEAEIEHIRRGALLHDIGKIAIPDAVLLKPGKLTSEERALIEQHPVYAYEMLSPIKFLQPAIDIPYCHHEKWDGTGYPRRLKGDEIPFAARIFSVVDVWDALVSDRPYRQALDPAEVRKYIEINAGKHFDPDVASAFIGLSHLLVHPGESGQ
ncbi:MAG: GAF domain-containing protein [Anaerolineales bacterium]|nr:GAF domain-containing protein [Anaerolineales bacterium]